MSQHRMVLGLLALAGATFFVAELGANPAPPPAQQVGGIMRVRIASPSDRKFVSPGEQILWDVRGFVSPRDNEGLALFSLDLVQDPNNPEFFNMPRSAGFTPELLKFDQPRGFTNPGIGTSASGFRGSSNERRGAQNIRQIGGAQNTFGLVGPCFGQTTVKCMGQDLVVDGGVGQLPEGIELASGRFLAPETPGTYVFKLENVIANTLESIEVAPTPSPTNQAAIRVLRGSIAFTVQ